MCLSDEVFNAASNDGIFMFLSSLNVQKMHFKISKCNFRLFYNLGIKNRRIDFIFAMFIVETSLHKILYVFKLKIDCIHFLKTNQNLRGKKNESENKKKEIRDSHVVALSFLHVNF